MQKLVIKSQFMGVKPCEIELRRFLLLIGEQASGKSTIAKLIYFFQTLPETIYADARNKMTQGVPFENLDNLTPRRFATIFKPSSVGNSYFDIIFYYKEDVFVQLKLDSEKGRFISNYSQELFSEVSKYVRDFIAEKKLDSENLKAETQLRRGLYNAFHASHSDFTYMVAGRNTATAFSEMIEDATNQVIEKITEDLIKGQDLEIRRRFGNELLFLEFVKWAKLVRDFFIANGGSFKSAQKSIENENNRVALSRIEGIAASILKGEYSSKADGEYIRVDNNNSIPLTDASSGQQEVLRILQGLFLAVGLKNRHEFFVVEEPEAHLYPLAQKELINAFAVFLNAIKEGRLIITTHSPYILACVNILLLAHFVNKERGGNGIEQQISETAVPKDYWLDPADFTTYAIGHSDIYCRNIKDDVTGLVAENYLDSISVVLGMQYRQLYDLLTLADA